MSYFEPPRPGAWMLALGVIFPLFVLLLELVSGMCADSLFDPVPSWGHAIAVAAVPAINLALWLAARSDSPHRPGLLIAAGAAMAIGGAYSLMFLPVMPVALIGILLLGIGLLPFAPALALIVTVKLAAAVDDGRRSMRRRFTGIAIGLVALLIVDLPSTATHVALRWAGGGEEGARRATALMRAVGDEEMLLRLCYGDSGRAGLLSFVIASWNEGIFSPRSVPTREIARELHFRATGLAFNAVEPPRAVARRQSGLFEFDREQGGEAVGGRLAAMRLADSRIDGSVSGEDNLAYLEWTAVFANDSTVEQEARATLALPPGAVASRATLWVKGQPREASVAGRGETRAAYQSVVRTRRDPLLVTTDGAGRLLVQAFPVMPGGSMKIRIGITAPLEIARDGSRSLALPALAERNFAVGHDLRHQLWIESRAPIAGTGFAVRRLASGVTEARAALADAALAAGPRVRTTPIREASTRVGTVGEAPSVTVTQRIRRITAPAQRSLAIVVDGSAANRAGADGLRRALDAIPSGLPVALFLASPDARPVPAAPWSTGQRARVEAALAGAPFRGGEDSLPALAAALDSAPDPESAILWIHGPQPVEFAASRGRLEQLLDRREALPRLVRYQRTPGAAVTVPGSAWFELAHMAAPSGDPAADLSALLDQIGGGERWQVERVEGTAAGAATGSPHIARLWAAEKLTGAGGSTGKEREQAIALAHRLNVVTPVSGAVVLERDDQYRANGLPVPGAADVPTVPEPGEWALIAIVLALLLWMWRRRSAPRPAFA
jgi:dolichol kinase